MFRCDSQVMPVRRDDGENARHAAPSGFSIRDGHVDIIFGNGDRPTLVSEFSLDAITTAKTRDAKLDSQAFDSLSEIFHQTR